MLAELDFDHIPNYRLDRQPVYSNPQYDPENKYTVPYTVGNCGNFL